MEQIMGLLFNMCYRVTIVITIVLLIRGIILRKFPRKYAFWLWGVVALCLLFPMEIVSSVSLFNMVPDGDEVVQFLSAQKTEENGSATWRNDKNIPKVGQKTIGQSDVKSNSIQSADMSDGEGDIESFKQDTKQDGQQEENVGENQNIEGNVSESMQQKEVYREHAEQELSLYQLLFWGWLTGILGLLLWNLLGWIKIKRKVRSAVLLEDKVYECEGIPGPFVLGIVSPKIYIPFRIEEEARQYILAHERYHIKRRDYLTKIVAAVITAVYWFHPLVWVAYILMCRDMEMSCDEYVLAGADNQTRVKYSESLLSFAMNKRNWNPQRMAFDSHMTKQRIKNVLTEHKQKRYMGIVFGIIAVIVSAVLLTQGEKDKSGKGKPELVAEEDATEKIKSETIAEEDLTELNVFVELASYSGLQEGWFGELLKQRFHVKLNILPYSDTENVLLGSDILLWASEDSEAYGLSYQSAKKQVMLLPLSDGKYGRTVTVSEAYHDDFFYTWDLRYELYQKCGSPQIKDLDDLRKVLKEMQSQYDGEKKVYGASIWSSFDGTHLAFAQMLCSGYYGFVCSDSNDGFVMYNKKGNTYGILEKEGPYIQSLRFLNQLYRDGLLDPDSRTNTYDDVAAKVNNGQVLWSLTDYTGETLYNNEANLAAGTAMYPVVPDDAVLTAYQTVSHKGRIAVNANTKHGDLCKQVVDYLCSPLCMMEMRYGPEGVCWYYDQEGKAHFTETGQHCYENENKWENIIETDEERYAMYDGMKFADGCSQLIFEPFRYGDINPDTGEKFEAKYWESYVPKKETGGSLWMAWKDANDATQIQTYLEKRGEYVIYAEDYSEEGNKPKSWDAVGKIVVQGSWDAVYADSEQEFQNCIKFMRTKAYKAGYLECMKYSMEQLKKQWKK